MLSQNLVHGDALTMRTTGGEPITFAEWGYLGKGKFQRRDFRLDVLTQMSAIWRKTRSSRASANTQFSSRSKPTRR